MIKNSLIRINDENDEYVIEVTPKYDETSLLTSSSRLDCTHRFHDIAWLVQSLHEWDMAPNTNLWTT